MSSFEEPSPKPETPKERVIHPSKFSIKFEDYGRTATFRGMKRIHFFLRKSPLTQSLQMNG
jgi:hypothetical protein